MDLKPRNPLWRVAAFAFIGILTGVAHGQARGQSGPPEDQSPAALQRAGAGNLLVGTWKLVSYGERTLNGALLTPYGQNPSGMAIYDNSGRFSVQIMKMPRATFPSGYDKATAEQMKDVYSAYLAYFGTWAIDDAHKAILENIRGSNQTFYVNRYQSQAFDIDHDRLTLRTLYELNGDQHSISIVWERLR